MVLLNPFAVGRTLPRAWRRLAQERERSRRDLGRMRGGVRQRVARADPVNPVTSAQLAGLRYVNDETPPGIRRVGGKNRFRYVAPNGSTIRDASEKQRIRALAIPPAWRDVGFAPIRADISRPPDGTPAVGSSIAITASGAPSVMR